MIQHDAPITNLQRDEEVVLYPSFGYRVNRVWRVVVEGIVFGRGSVNFRKRLMIRLLGRAMRVEPTDLDSEIFRERIEGFVATPEGGRRMAVEVAGRKFQLQKKSKRNGHFRGALRLTGDDVDRFGWDKGGARMLPIQLVTPPGDRRTIESTVRLIEPTGWSVISDIDDTIKHTDCSSRRTLLANTFLNDFREIDGMASLYQQWGSQGAAFHYVSSSPWQLFGPLAEYQDEYGFPDGTFHLRSFRLRDHMLRRMLLLRRKGKAAVVRRLVHLFPERRFVLVGDSGERDPEIYAACARKYPDQVSAI
ncbi:MAG: App1 family protein, partial [Pirellulaceae bacterium]|nr:App1 family protein [Pirellulaceae bacterium]